jgi:F-type H+-transporting ATPase subunit epsilon
MHLKILLPYKIMAEASDVSSIVAETSEGSLGVLPHRLDCVAALVPGILSYAVGEKEAVYLATDQGVLSKAGDEVLVSVRRAVRGSSLGELRDAVIRDYRTLGGQERELRAVVARMESAFIARVTGLQYGR